MRSSIRTADRIREKKRAPHPLSLRPVQSRSSPAVLKHRRYRARRKSAGRVVRVLDARERKFVQDLRHWAQVPIERVIPAGAGAGGDAVIRGAACEDLVRKAPRRSTLEKHKSRVTLILNRPRNSSLCAATRQIRSSVYRSRILRKTPRDDYWKRAQGQERLPWPAGPYEEGVSAFRARPKIFEPPLGCLQ